MSATDLLTAMHCALDDGDVNEAGRLNFRLNSMGITGDNAAWHGELKSLYLACCGSLS